MGNLLNDNDDGWWNYLKGLESLATELFLRTKLHEQFTEAPQNIQLSLNFSHPSTMSTTLSLSSSSSSLN